MQVGKVPPQAPDLEAAILGACLLEKGAYHIAAELLTPEHFYIPGHVLVFQAMQSLRNQSRQIDLLTVVSEMKTLGTSESFLPYEVSKLTNAVISSAHLEDHCRIVHEKYVRRQLIRLNNEHMNLAYDDTFDVFDLVAELEGKVSKLSFGDLSNTADAAKMVIEVMNRMEAMQNKTHALTGVDTGFSSLNRLTGGWQPTDLIIIAARPSVGKTAFALNLTRSACMAGVGVAFFSLEMSKVQLMSRLVSCHSEVSMRKVYNGHFVTEDERQVIYNAGTEIANWNLLVEDSANLNVYQIKSKVKRMMEDGIGLVVIDYLQLMKGVEDRRINNREQEISNISRQLKGMAKELNLPVIALSQLSRDVEKREKKEPRLSDLRESGAIEQDADMVVFLQRGDYQQLPSQLDGDMASYVEATILKHRNGALDKFAYNSNLDIQKFSEYNQFQTTYTPLAMVQVIPPPSGYTSPVKDDIDGDSDAYFDKPF